MRAVIVKPKFKITRFKSALFPQNLLKMSYLTMLKTVLKHPRICSFIQRVMGYIFWAETQLPSKFCENLPDSFLYNLADEPRTNEWTWVKT